MDSSDGTGQINDVVNEFLDDLGTGRKRNEGLQKSLEKVLWHSKNWVITQINALKEKEILKDAGLQNVIRQLSDFNDQKMSDEEH